MFLSKFAVNRPIATLMFFIVISLMGVISWFKLPQDLFPKVSYPQVTVVTSYYNAAPGEIENLVTKPIEESISTVSNLKRLKSISREGLSLVTAEFGWDTKMDFAALSVRQKIDLIKERLPKEASEPIVKKFNPFDMPILILSIKGDLEGEKLLEYCKKVLKDGLAKVPGVASVAVHGGREPEILVEVDAGLLRARNIDIRKIGQHLKEANLNYPAGTTKETYFECLIRTEGEFKSLAEIKRTVIDMDYESIRDDVQKPMGIVRLEDIAEVKRDYAELTNISRYNGEENILLSIYKQSDANTIATVKLINEKLKSIDHLKNTAIIIDIVYDKSSFIKNAISGVKFAGIQGGILAFVVLLFFLQSVSSAVIVSITIPISILATFILMYFGGVTVNIMSLGGLALGIGMLVDSSIVVVENIVRKRTVDKLDKKQAAHLGASQVGTAILASTLTTIAVFLPMIFLTGIEGQLFKELSFTVTFALLASLLISLTLIPRLKFTFKESNGSNRLLLKCSTLTTLLQKKYETLLTIFLKNKEKYLKVILSIFLVSVVVLSFLPKELLPQVDEGQFGIKVTLPAGSSIGKTDKEIKKLEHYLINHSDVAGVSLSIGSKVSEAIEGSQLLGSHQGQLTVVLKGKRRISTGKFIKQLYADITPKLLSETKVECKLTSSGLGSVVQASSPINIEIKSENVDDLNKQAEYVYKSLESIEGIINIQSTLSDSAPETKIKIDKQRAASFNLTAQDISLAIQAAVKGRIATKYKGEEGLEIPIRVRLGETFRNNISQIENLPIWTDKKTTVFLSDVATLSQGFGPSEIMRINQRKIVLITADIAGVSMEKVKQMFKRKLASISKLDNVDIDFVETSKEKKQAFYGMIFMLVLSIVLVYMIMAAQFESLLQPFLIMVTVPLGMIGVTIALIITNTSLNIVAGLGIIMLAGIVVNNGIVLIEYINEAKQKQSISVSEAVIEACSVRFRPIIMTTATTLLGLLPLSLGLGEGAELRSPMAISVMGGLLISTILTLLVLPALYLKLEEFRSLK